MFISPLLLFSSEIISQSFFLFFQCFKVENYAGNFESFFTHFFKKIIGEQLIYNVALVSAVQKSESVIHMHISTF